MDAVKLFGSKLAAKDDKTVDTASEFGDDVELVGIYFSAHWCPPCRSFTPVLADFYKAVNENKKRLEIVFVSHDRDEKSFKDYLNEMPWLAVTFDNSEIKETLIGAHEVRGIPKLVFLSKDGNVKFSDGRGKVTEPDSVKNFPWA